MRHAAGLLSSIALSAACVGAGVANDLVITQDLGIINLDRERRLEGSTAGAPRDADVYGFPLSNGNIRVVGGLYEQGERVYRFELTQRGRVNLVNLQGFGVGANHDHFLLNSPEIVDIPGSPAPKPGSSSLLYAVGEQDPLGAHDPGVYYLSVDTQNGSPEGEFDLLLQVQEPVFRPGPPAPGRPSASSMGTLGQEGGRFIFNTDGSEGVLGGDLDTIVALWGQDGQLVALNDDYAGRAISRLDTDNLGQYGWDTLGAGEYYLAVFLWGPGVTVGQNFSIANNGDGEFGFWELRTTGNRFYSGTISGSQVLWFRFTVSPGPCAVDFSGNGTVDVQDLVLFIQAFKAGQLSADFNGNGVLEARDITTFVAAYRKGC